MTPRMLFMLLLASGPALAQPNGPDELARLKSSLHQVQEEEQSVYQSYQMLKELRLHLVQQNSPPMVNYPQGMDIYTPPPNYEDVLRAQQAREARIRQYTADLDRLATRFFELERERKSLAEDIAKREQGSGR